MSVLYPVYSSLHIVWEFNGCRAEDLIRLFGRAFQQRNCWRICIKFDNGGWDKYLFLLRCRFRASLTYINNCQTRCNTNQSVYYSASSLCMFRVSTTPIIRSTQNCNYSLRYCAGTSLQRGQLGHVGEVDVQKIWPAKLATLEGGSCTKNMTSTGGCSYSIVYSRWWVWLTPETCRVNLQNNKQTALCCISLGSYWYGKHNFYHFNCTCISFCAKIIRFYLMSFREYFYLISRVPKTFVFRPSGQREHQKRDTKYSILKCPFRFWPFFIS